MRRLLKRIDCRSGSHRQQEQRNNMILPTTHAMDAKTKTLSSVTTKQQQQQQQQHQEERQEQSQSQQSLPEQQVNPPSSTTILGSTASIDAGSAASATGSVSPHHNPNSSDLNNHRKGDDVHRNQPSSSSAEANTTESAGVDCAQSKASILNEEEQELATPPTRPPPTTTTPLPPMTFFRVANLDNNLSKPSTQPQDATAAATATTTATAVKTTTLRQNVKVLRGFDRRQKRQAAAAIVSQNEIKSINSSLCDFKNPQDLISAMTKDERALQQQQQHKQQHKQPMQHGRCDIAVNGSSNGVLDSNSNNIDNEEEDEDNDGEGEHYEGDWDDDEYNDNNNNNLFPSVEWTLKLVDPETTMPQTMQGELQRLQVLHSYFVLDAQTDKMEFDCITQLASQIFQTKTCLISLVDLGRQWFLSRVGLDAMETPRKYAFCAHVILSQQQMLVIPNATQDIRFQNNPLVVDPNGPQIRFYAGAALQSPEGYNLGTLCVIDYQPRPQGFTIIQQQMLHSMAAMVMNVMVARRDRLLRQEYETKLHILAQQTLSDAHIQLQQAQKALTTIAQQQQQQQEQELLRKLQEQQEALCKNERPQENPDPNPIEEEEEEEEEEVILPMKGGDLLGTAVTTTTTTGTTTDTRELMNQVSETLNVQSTIMAATMRNIVQEIPAPTIKTREQVQQEDGKDRFAGFRENMASPPITAKKQECCYRR